MKKQMLAFACAALLCVPQSASAVSENERKLYSVLAGGSVATFFGALLYLENSALPVDRQAAHAFLSKILLPVLGTLVGKATYDNLRFKTPEWAIHLANISTQCVDPTSPQVDKTGNWVFEVDGTTYSLTPQQGDELIAALNNIFDESLEKVTAALAKHNIPMSKDAQKSVALHDLISGLDRMNGFYTEQEERLQNALPDATQQEETEINTLLEKFASHKKTLEFKRKKASELLTLEKQKASAQAA